MSSSDELPIPLTALLVRRLAAHASCDPRTIRAVAAGRTVRGLAGQRARAALSAAGYPLPEKDFGDGRCR
jgi:hypothetical protein